MTAIAPEVSRPVLTFEEEPHIYRVDGRPVISVTTVIKECFGDLVWPWANEFAMKRGSHVHKALHLYALNELDVKGLSPYIAGYVAAGIRFLAETGFEIHGVERRMYSEIYDVAGTSDLDGILDRKLTIADYKTGEPGWAAGPQTAAYAHMLQETTGDIPRQRIGVHLHEDGTYKIVHYKNDREDWADFLAARRVVARRKALSK